MKLEAEEALLAPHSIASCLHADPTGESVLAMMLTWKGAAGYYAAYGIEEAGATGEDTVCKRTRIRQGEVGYLLSRGGTHKNR